MMSNYFSLVINDHYQGLRMQHGKNNHVQFINYGITQAITIYVAQFSLFYLFKIYKNKEFAINSNVNCVQIEAPINDGKTRRAIGPINDVTTATT